MIKVLFIDRDGTLHVDKVETHKVNDLELFEDTVKFLLHMLSLNYSIIIVTNQSGIGKGHYSIADMNRFNFHLVEVLKEYGVSILDIYYCPHTIEDDCECMKSNPGMIYKAVKDYNIDISKSLFVGDQVTDMYAGKNAGIQELFLVTTWMYKGELYIPDDLSNVHLVDSLSEIIKFYQR